MSPGPSSDARPAPARGPAPDPLAAPRRVPAATDLRLLGPAVLAWAVAAAGLGLAPRAHLGLAAAPALVIGAAVGVRSARRALCRWGVIGPLLLIVALVVVL